MKVTLHLNGSAAAICAFLATVPESLIGGDTGTLDNTMTPMLTPMMPALTDESDDDAPASANAPATDSTGLPWDERIHAKSKTFVAGDKWRKRKGVADAVVAMVEAELRGSPPAAISAPVAIPTAPMTMTMPMMAPAAQPVPMMQPVAMQPEPVATPMPMMAPVAAPSPVAMPVIAPQPEPVAAPTAPPAPAGEIDMAGFMAHLTGLMQSGRVTTDDLVAVVGAINAAFAPHGHPAIGAITDAGNDPQKLNYAVQVLQANGKW